ncbi:MAG: MlaD family protein [Pirellula sp.]|jgi:paraquat-inducible protein B
MNHELKPSDSLEALPASTIRTDDGSIPHARLIPRSQPKKSAWWIVALLSIGASLGTFFYAYKTSGTEIVIEFVEGYGIKPEDRLRHHGIDIGAVSKVELSRDLSRVLVSVRLNANANEIAREGSQFWIVRPALSFENVSGLDTILGAKYLSVRPGSSDSRHSTRFVGLETAPISTAKDGALEITLDSSTRGGLSNGAPILFRGYRIGNIIQVGLASDARSVRARCAIDPEYRDLVRPNSRFWNRSGWKLNIGITGVKIDADSMAQILTGGIEMATPQSDEAAVNTGHSFVLYDEAQPEWLAWQPSIGHGLDWQEKEKALPTPIRMALRWQERSFGFRTNKQTAGWCLPLDDGSFLCLLEQITAPNDALGDSVLVELAGVAIKREELAIEIVSNSNDKLVRFRTNASMDATLTRWPTKKISTSQGNDSSFVISGGEPVHSIVIDANRVERSGEEWKIESGIVSNTDLTGAPVVDYQTHAVVGVIAKRGEDLVIIPYP